jgi:glycosyltransferase involved in cell wall biosynthesis
VSKLLIFLINHYAGSPHLGMEFRPYYFGQEWTKLGHSVQIIAASFSHLRSQTPEITGGITEDSIDGLNYIWLKTPPYDGNGFRRVINIFSFIIQALRYNKQLLENGYPNVVIASSTYPLDIFPAYFLAKKSKAKLIFEVHDLWPLTLIEIGGFKAHHPLIVLFQIAENFAYRKADLVVSMLPKAAGYMQKHGMTAEKFLYIPNGVDIKEWESKREPIPNLHKTIISEAKETGLFLIGYFGTIGLANDLGSFIDAAKHLVNQPLMFILVGQGGELDDLRKSVSENKLSNVVFLPHVPKNCIPNLLSEMDVLYIGWKKSPIYRFGISPNKLLDYMMSARPIIHSIEAGNDPVAECGCGISVEPGKPALIAEAIMKLYYLTPEDRDEIGSKGRQFVINNHDVSKLAIEMLKQIQGEEAPLEIVMSNP